MTTDLAALSNPDEIAGVPAFLQDGSAETSLGILSQYAQPPRMKLRQPTARPPLSDIAPEGSVVLMPSMQIVAGKEEEFHVVPVFFYPEWCVFNPLSMTDLPTIRERSLDPKSEIAQRSRNPETRTAPVPGFEGDYNHQDQKKRKALSYREHLNFIFELQDGPLAGTQFVATFAKAEHKTGRTLASNIQMRSRSSGVHPCGLVFAAQCKRRQNKDGIWYGLDLYLPTSGASPFVQSKAHYDKLKKMHDELLDSWKNQSLGDFIKPEGDEGAEPSAESSDF